MIKYLFKPDSLTLFLVLAIVLLLQISGTSLIFNRSSSSLVRYVDAKNVVSSPEQGYNTNKLSIATFSESFEIWYSLDGGESFQNGGSEIELNYLKNPELKNIETSFHQKPFYGSFPKCLSLVYKVKHKTENIISEENYLTVLKHKSDLPVVNLVTHQSNIDGYEKGIMVFGKEAEEDAGFYKNWWNRNANFQNRGVESERPVHMQYFVNGVLDWEQDLAMRISGNATRGFPQKSIRISANRMYGKDKIEYNFFGKEGLKKYTSLVIRNSGNDNTKTMFADLLMQKLVTSENILTQKGQPVEVFLNGNYWGIYNVRERIDVYLISKKEDVKIDEVTLLESNGELKEGLDSDRIAFEEFIEQLEKENLSGEEILQLADQTIDLLSFIDYIIYETYYGNGDWPNNNVQWYKAGNSKWKWILQDLDYGMAYSGKQNIEVNLFEKLKKSEGVISTIFNALLLSDQFKNMFYDRAAEILECDFSTDRVSGLFEETKSRYNSAIEFQIRRWRMIDSREDWEQNCRNNLDFLLNRSVIYNKQVEDLK